MFNANGRPLQPSEHVTKFINQCGVLARDNIPITVHEWKKPKDSAGVRYVSDRSKEDLWRKLMENFNLPPDYQEEDEDGNPDPEGKARMETVKKFALKKIGEAFRNFKKNLWAAYVKNEKKAPPEFKGEYVKLKHQWAEFVAYKESEEAKKKSEKSKKNASKKKHHHYIGPSGYKGSVHKWEAMEADLTTKGIPLGTAGWPERAKHWWYGHGGKLHPEIGKCMHRDKVFTPTQKLIDAMADAAAGKYRVDREKDELTRALGNDEKPGRVRGRGPGVSWKEGFSADKDRYGYRSRKRKKDREADQIANIQRELSDVKKTLTEVLE